MAKPDYDTTLARIAGNIAAGMNDDDRHEIEKCEKAVRMARKIVKLCREPEEGVN